MKIIKLNPEAGNLPQWAEQQAARLSKLPSMQPCGATCVGIAKIYRGLNNALRSVGIEGQFRENIARDICDMARLMARANN